MGGGWRGVPPSPGRNPSVSWCCCPLTSPNPPRIVDPGPRRRRPHRRHPCPILRGVTMAGQMKVTSQRIEKEAPRRQGGRGTRKGRGRGGRGGGGGRVEVGMFATYDMLSTGEVFAAEANRSTHRFTGRFTETGISTERESIDRNRPTNTQKPPIHHR